MQLNISGHHLEVTPSLREYVTSKIDRLEKHHDKITTTDVTLIVDKQVQKAEARIHVSGADLFADATADDMYAAIDGLADKLNRQLIRHKEKLKAHR
ncbi:MAG TPA: ribosome-associated translation inhibitor RaiA [Pseudomonadales bacterium]|nr:ribosome-associated translation inhibitor RaiA [Pseudomonadales bacterium]